MNVLDLFSGIGGFSLGLERAGMRTVAFCEIEPYCQAVLRKHWPDVPVFGDVRELTAKTISNSEGIGREHGGDDASQSGDRWDASTTRTSVNVICGGFPCQDISVAGKGAGIEGSRSGLWSEYARIVGEVRPRYVIVENVAALLGRGLGRVLGDLAALGYDAEWHCIPASAVGAPHRRDRVWIVAHAASGIRQRQTSGTARYAALGREDVADTRRELLEGRLKQSTQGSTQWLTEPDVGRVAHGVSARVDRLRALGNAIVPQIAEIIGRAIMSANP
jgi:DNA (cytosine-5)-methyltransferase 1